MARAPWAPDGLYDVAARWVESCLRDGGSLFTPGSSVWTKDVVDEAAPRLLHDDTSDRDYLTKFRDQLDGVSDPALQFTAEALYVHLLPIVNMGAPSKHHLLDETIALMRAPVKVPPELEPPLAGGVANYGAGIAQRDRYVKYLVRFAQAWMALDTGGRAERLADPWLFRDLVHDLGGPPLMQREAILHLVFPETFEYAIAPNDKSRIVKAFAGFGPVKAAADGDRALAEIRTAVEQTTGRPLNLYAPWFGGIWREAEQGRWPETLEWAKRIKETPDFDEEERDYKLTIGERMRKARSDLETGDSDWVDALKSAFGAPNNITNWRFEHGPFLEWCQASPDEARRFLLDLWAQQDLTAEGLNEVLEGLPIEVLRTPAARLTLTSLLLFGIDATRYPPYRSTVLSNFKKLIGEAVPAPDIDLDDEVHTPTMLGALLDVDPKRIREFLRERYPRESDEKGADWELTPDQTLSVVGQFAPKTSKLPGETYLEFLTVLDGLQIRLLAQGVELRDRLDAQSIEWVLSYDDSPMASWSEEVKTAFAAFKAGAGGPPLVPKPIEPVRIGGVMPEKAWLVRGAKVGGINVVREWLAEGYVSIGWHELGDLEVGLGAQEIWERVKSTYSDDAAGSWRVAAGNLNRFLNLIKVGHLVLTADGDALYIGEVTGDVYTEPSSAGTFLFRRRSVRWLNPTEPASRTAVASAYPTLYSKLRTLLTVTDLKEDVALVAALAGFDVGKSVGDELVVPPITEDLATSLHVPLNWLQHDIAELLLDKKQLIFYGPPGTGKTLVAQRIAEHLVRDGGEYELIQFHPSYSYEDFFEGYRPAQADGSSGLTYELTPGPLRRIAQEAAVDPRHPYVLIIDEINRGNVPKIFGELLFLLEYREAQIPLQYSPTTLFGLPRNLFVIATMNTADRSIALVDAALRRRFYFVPFMPREKPVGDVLSSWLARHQLDGEPARLMKALNDRIATDEIAIGPSYFITSDGSSPNLERVWKHAITPLLEEHYYGTGRSVESEFGLKALRQALAGTGAALTETVGEVPEGAVESSPPAS